MIKNNKPTIIDEIHSRLKKRNVRHSLHALKEEMREGLTALEVEEALLNGFELIEDYPHDPRGHSCLILIRINDKPVHMVCAPHEEALIIVTVYVPSIEEWKQNFRTRRKER